MKHTVQTFPYHVTSELVQFVSREMFHILPNLLQEFCENIIKWVLIYVTDMSHRCWIVTRKGLFYHSQILLANGCYVSPNYQVGNTH